MFQSCPILPPHTHPFHCIAFTCGLRPVFHMMWVVKICGFSVNFLRFARFFVKGVSQNHGLSSSSRLCAFAPSREIHSLVCRVRGGWVGSRQSAKASGLGEIKITRHSREGGNPAPDFNHLIYLEMDSRLRGNDEAGKTI
jgi:hypothetical protein